jgi:tetratricopeptide (TPR) repeat protein
MRTVRFIRILLASTLVLVALWLTLVWWWGQSAAKAYRDEDYDKAAERYSLALSFMPFERWKGLFGQGTAVLANDQAPRAQELLTKALEVTPPDYQCPVRINLSLAMERQGDDAVGAAGTARAFYEDALATLEDAGCPDKDEKAAESAERLRQKLEEPEDEPPPPDPGAPDDPNEGQGEEGEDEGEGDGGGGEGEGDDEGQGEGGQDEGDGEGGGEDEGDGGDGGQTPQPTDPLEGSDPEGRRERLERLREQNRNGQTERQDQDYGDYGGGWNQRNW